MNSFANFQAFMALYDRLQAPPVTPEERLTILTGALKAIQMHVQPPGCLEVVERLVADLQPKEPAVARQTRKSR